MDDGSAAVCGRNNGAACKETTTVLNEVEELEARFVQPPPSYLSCCLNRHHHFRLPATER